MKLIAIVCAALFLGINSISAQENKDVDQKTTIKKVVTKDTTVQTKVIKETDTEVGVVVVEGNEKEDQNTNVVTRKVDDKQVVVDDVSEDANNKAMQEEIARKKKLELEASIKAEKEKAEREKAALAAIKEAQLKEMEANRQRLEHRPKGMAKLQKDN
ncbi:hypothetical protein ATE92_2248 [Ulvibacter sp. MAR_2010_11]|uniref:hypothetical protein n=1 Tax=Ulvibacter sp. MAR_2010_11 TaxID=1250229 RepID=UPI000C2BC2C7|nr:hypothetical protein [Ulvibacter sp. MAR_2010_11]PKA84078.1 hypothetical protein ATE92_2248 [Ulvibacter sp. MAR_2010_11]